MTLSQLPRPRDVVAGRYVLLRVRGEGMMGVVYEADDSATGQRVAVKVLRPEMATVDDVRERLAREGQLVARMRNAHVVRVLDMGTTSDGLPFFVMELLRGTDLAALLDRGKSFSIPEAVKIAREACAGLAEAHALNVIHRDIKPHNMFLAENPDGSSRIVLLDFGVSKVMGSESELTITQASIGTPLYMAPEQVRSARNVDERSDVWAVAVVLFELCTGAPPFEGESAHAVTAAIVADPPKRLRELLVDAPEALEQVIATALQKDPKLRYPSALALSDALAPFDTGASSSALQEQATLVMATPLDPDAMPASARVRTELAAPLPPPVLHATVMEPPVSYPGYTPPAAPTAPPASHAIGPAPARDASKLMPALLAATVLLALAGVGLLVMLGLEHRRQPAATSAPVAASAPGTVADALAAARDAQGLAPFEPCVWRSSDRVFVATSPREPLPEAMQDLDGRFGNSPPPSFMLERAFAKGTGDITLAAVTPLSPALREPPTPLLVVTDEHLYAGFLGERGFEKVDDEAQRRKLKETVSRGAQHWVLAAEGRTPLDRLELALGLLNDNATSVTFAVPLAANSKRPPIEANAGAPCDAAAQKAARWISDAEWAGIGPATRVREEACGREAAWLSGRSVRVVLFPGAREACLEEATVPSEGQGCALDAAKKLALGVPMGKKPEPVRFDFVFRGPSVRALCDRR